MNNHCETWFHSNNVEFIKEKIDEQIKFKKNGILITKEDNESNIDENEFINLIKENVNSFANKNFDKIILLTGAGSSVTGNSSNILGKTMKDLVVDINEKLEEDSECFSLEELTRKVIYDDYPEDNVEEINLEDFLTMVNRFEPFVLEEEKLKYQRTKYKILNTIRENTSYHYDGEFLKHTKIINYLSKKIKTPNKLTIVTTNYDTMFEEAAEEIGFFVIDGFTYSLKPHFNSEEFEWHMVKNVPNVKTKELEYKRNIIELIKLHGSLTWEYTENSILRKAKEEIDQPHLIFPSTEKFAQSYEPPYFELFAKFQELLAQNNTLVITSGFSFGDAHVTSIIERAVKRNKGLSMLVTDFNINQFGDGWKTIEKLKDDKFPVAFLKTSFNELINFLEYYYDN